MGSSNKKFPSKIEGFCEMKEEWQPTLKYPYEGTFARVWSDLEYGFDCSQRDRSERAWQWYVCNLVLLGHYRTGFMELGMVKFS
uniref:AlNc14C837G12563 protein n=1 Tax=Albugo laibachii Nc14 TaxID=890382 RepID=F0X253_9STRA|nr:AlNc14C837G12563 [Albugo laibachii Nc14]|eukprot:CCA27926.1 AlNc14C837G12563 [Albugo laibachii Nc14]